MIISIGKAIYIYTVVAPTEGFGKAISEGSTTIVRTIIVSAFEKLSTLDNKADT